MTVFSMMTPLPFVVTALCKLMARSRRQTQAGRESLLRSWTHQCPQRHQGSDGNILVIHQLFLRERQRFHNGSCLVLGLRVDQEDDAFAIAARIPLADFPVEVELHSRPNPCRYDGQDLLSGYALLGIENVRHNDLVAARL